MSNFQTTIDMIRYNVCLTACAAFVIATLFQIAADHLRSNSNPF